MANGNQNDVFKKSIDEAISNLSSLETKIDGINTKMSRNKDTFHKTSDAISDMAKSIGELDGRKIRKLETLSSSIKTVLANLSGMNSIQINKDAINSLVDAANKLSALKLDFSSLDKLAKSIDSVNDSLQYFLKLSKSLNDVDLQKLASFEANIKGPKRHQGNTGDPGKFVKSILSKYDKDSKLLGADIGKRFAEFTANPQKQAVRGIAERKLAHGDYFEQGVTLENASEKQIKDALGKYNADLNKLYARVDAAKSKPKTSVDKAAQTAAIEQIKTEEAGKRLAEKAAQKKAESEEKERARDLEFQRRKDLIHEKEAAEQRRREAVAADKDERAAKKKADEDEQLKRTIIELEEQLKAGTGQVGVVNKLVDAQSRRGDFLFPTDPDNITEEDYRRAAQAKEMKRADYMRMLKTKEGKAPVDYELRAQRIAEENKARAAIAHAKRNLISQRTEARLQKKLTDAQNKLEYDKTHAKSNAISRLVQTTFGSNSPVLQDLVEASGILGKDFESVRVLRDKRATIESEYNLENKKIDNEEIDRTQQIRYAGLSAEQKRMIDDKDTPEDVRKSILESADSSAEVEENLKNLGKEMAEKRTKLNTETSEKLIANEEAINKASLKAAGTLAQFVVALKILKVSVEAIWKASKKAAQSNTEMAASLKSMGASASEINSDSIKYFTNELKNSGQRLKSIGRDLGEMLGGAAAGWSILIDEVLKGIEWITDKLAKLPGFANAGIQADSKDSINYATSILTNIASKLDKGINVNGIEVKVDKEVAYKALNSTFGMSKTQGFDNASSANLASLVSGMAAKIQANYGVDYTTASKQVSEAIFSGSNSASAYGIVIDDQVLAGYAALEKELDIVNVQYTDAYKSALRYEMAEQMMSKGNSKEMQDKIKKWKQLGDVIQTASGQLFDFQEVQSIEAKDFTIPEISATGNIVADAENLTDLNKKLSETGELWVHTGKGLMTFQEALLHVNGDLSQFKLYMNTATGEMILATSDYLPSLTDAEQALHTEVGNGVVAIAMYANYLKLSKDRLLKLGEEAGLTNDQLNALADAYDKVAVLHIDYSDLEEARQAAAKLNRELAKGGWTPGGNVARPGSGSKADKMSKYDPHIQKYVRQGYKFADGSTIDDIGFGTWLNGTFNPFSKVDREKVDTQRAFTKAADGIGGDILVGAEKGVNALAKITAGVAAGQGFGLLKGVDAIGTGINALNAYGAGVPMSSAPLLLGHADGGLSFKDHVARVSEGNSKEVILPVSSQETIDTMAQVLQKTGLTGQGQGVTVESVNLTLEGVNMVDDPRVARRLAETVYENISIIQRERGDMNYGIK